MLQALDLLMILVACLCLMAGSPVAFTLSGVALLFAGLGWLAGAPLSLGAVPSRIYGIMTNQVLIAVPLFVFMGVMLERSRVAESLLNAMGRLVGGSPGGLGLSVTLVGTLLAASTGIVGATVATLGLLALPAMLKQGYDARLAAGSVAASGTLGQIIPPSIVLVVLGDQISAAYRAAQLKVGNFAPETVTVGDLFAGALVPGLLLATLYALYQVVTARLSPQKAPPMRSVPLSMRDLKEALAALLPPAVLIIAVLGSILAGLATPTEAASVGALGAILLAGRKLGGRKSVSVLALASGSGVVLLATIVDLEPSRAVGTASGVIALAAAIGLAGIFVLAFSSSVRQVHHGGILQDALRKATEITAMIFTIVIGASIFSLVFRDLGGEELIASALSGVPGGAGGAVLAVMLVMFALGFFLDFLEIVFVVVPIVTPALLGIPLADGSMLSPVWLAVMMAVNLQTSFLTPPFGFALFYLRGVAPQTVKTADIYLGAMPFVALQLLMLLILWFYPSLATWLPAYIYG
ncbi:TRAP transporter large permease subunit [Rhizobiales bacterium]|uniref:TRAP transporter large permease n=1 Tax=Hongsoonwoonella zoysiae TaxID=2821844 RepID=UPI00155F7707|nr:TRAP transporter large permease subunit [Hongsoonwoonella zoysiae]NRG17283.1 TRAP transporter large permease subunit [Hongsoonwoonella zoysiae]